MLLKNTLMILVMLGCLLNFQNAFAEAEEVDISLKATIKNNPAFKPVSWKLFRVGENKPIMTGSRHSMTFKMKPGFYKVVAVMGDVKRDKQFTVAPKVSREILVSMD